MAPRSGAVERSCLVLREKGSTEGLIRFVVGPGGVVVPDIQGKLPGRGVWVTGERELLLAAVKRRLFARGLKAEVTVGPEIADLVDRLLASAALGSLSMARKAGLVVTGMTKVASALSRQSVVAVIHAVEAAGDGRRKIAQAMRRRARLERLPDDDGDFDAADEESDDDEDDDVPVPEQPIPDAAMPRVIAGLFSVAELDLALGGANVIHAALLAGGASSSFLRNAAALARFRGGQPVADDMTGPAS
jgi:uncharacterized protein